jgi:hypothetical protein
MTTDGVSSGMHSPRADVAALSEDDLSEIAAFIAIQSGRDAASVEAHLRWFLLQNPARRPEDPLGFGLRSNNVLVGCILCVPQAFCLSGEKVLLMGSSSFYVDQDYRGQGGRLFLKYSRLANHQPIFGTSANAEAAGLWKAAGAEPIPYSDAELFGVLRWPPLIEELVQRKYSNRLLTRLARSSISKLAGLLRPLKIDGDETDGLRHLTRAEEVLHLQIQKGVASNQLTGKLTALRDLPYIRWRYFSNPDASAAAFAFRSQLCNQEVLVTVNQRRRGYRDQIKTLNVLDVYPESPPGDWLLIVAALIARYTGVIDTVVLRSQNPEREKMFCGKGFYRRAFDAPTSWYLDKANLLPKRDWYFVPADGDGLI